MVHRTATLGAALGVVLALVSCVAAVGTSTQTEGKIVFYSERGQNAELYTMNVDGTGLVRLTTNSSNEFCPDWSPDGTQIVYESDRDDPHPVTCFPDCAFRIYVMNADGTSERRLTSLDGLEGHPDWSPDGRSIVFQADRDGNGKHEIYLAPSSGGEPRLLLGDAFDNTAPDWSPDGRSIAFNSDREGNLDIFVVDVDGMGLRKVIDTGINDYSPDWSPDGREILFFSANWPTVKQTIYVVGADGSGLRALTATSRVVNESAQWSPDGERIVFQSDRDYNFEIYSMKSDGTDVVRLTRQSGGDYWPDMWAPAPEKEAQATAQEEAREPAEAALPDTEDSALAFVSTRDGRAQIYTMNADGSELQQITRGVYEHYYPAWSPDGSKLACYVHLSWQAWALVVMDADGEDIRQITESAGCATCAMGPYWSPDGTRIGFTVEPNSRPTCEIKSTELAVVNADGTECQRLTENAWNDLFSGWSPDGASILFTSSRTGKTEVWVMDSDLSGARCLTDDASEDTMPAWSPDGARIAFVSKRDGNDELYVMDCDGTNVMRITNNPAHDWMPAWSADGSEILFSSDRDSRELEVYSVRLVDLSVRRLTTASGYDYEAVWRP